MATNEDSTPEITLDDRIEKAIRDHCEANGGGFPVGWYLVADIVDGKGEGGWIQSYPDDQKLMTSFGMIRWAQNIVDYEQRRYLESGPGCTCDDN